MQQRLVSFAVFVSIIGISLAWAQAQVEVDGQASAVKSTGGSTSASASSSASGSARGSAGGSVSGGGFMVSGGKVNGQNVYVIDYDQKSSSAESTDSAFAAAKEHDTSFSSQVAKQGMLVIAGTYMDDGSRSMTIVAQDEATATKVAESSPLVKKGSWSYKVRPFNMVAMGNGATRNNASKLTPINSKPNHP